jgi:antitoxin ParD1/3/4
MNVSLTPALEQFIRDRAESGDYNNASEVVREAVRLLKRMDERRQLRLDGLRRAVKEGDDAISRGEFMELSSDGELDAFFDGF